MLFADKKHIFKNKKDGCVYASVLSRFLVMNRDLAPLPTGCGLALRHFRRP